MRSDCMPTRSSAGCSLEEKPTPLQTRIDRADEMLAKLIDYIGTGPALAIVRRDMLRIKHILRDVDE